MAHVFGVGAEFDVITSFDGCDLVAGGDLHQLWCLCSAKLHCSGRADRLRDGGFSRNLRHYGDVFAVQWNIKDFPYGNS